MDASEQAAEISKKIAEKRAAFRRRIGRFTVSFRQLEFDIFNIQKMFLDIEFVPTEVCSNYSSQELWYTGLSPKFEELAEGSKIPIYVIRPDIEGFHVSMLEDTEIKFYFRSPNGKPKATPKSIPQ